MQLSDVVHAVILPRISRINLAAIAAAAKAQQNAAFASTRIDDKRMPRTARLFLVLGCIAALLAVAIGAFGAHGLKARVAPELMSAYKTGVEYHFYHAFGLILTGLAALRLPESAWLKAAGWAMLTGITLFSGSLYLLALTGLGWLGAITPLGGVAFLAAWTLLATAVVKAR
jgi:uncharacterized membrane protein YgdD (TMEM256/DUF423 family)